ncbi:P63C domain-containing protein [Methylobacterium sp. yr596]|uniref:P63C domain-containing protein n=1 Tax=Methylobacterium sp. yr596 TaxID=1761800 RepID=UPI0008E39D75|nr:P63C domain-containing protein [Methylobacterium sp. yr596]SFF17042.1 P63C domain-containing protein [Methylobacterium sp. yr596]
MPDNQSKGGKARAAKLSSQERSAIASAAAAARWAKEQPERADLPKAAYGSDDRPVKIGPMEIPCFVLEDERRVLTAGGFQSALTIAQGGSMKKGMSRLALFIDGKLIKPFVPNDLVDRVQNPIFFITPSGKLAYGYEASLLVKLCDAVLAARAAGVLQAQQKQIAYQCELIMRGLALVGIDALVDEATGFQEFRKRDALHRILEAYIAPELMKWTKRFPDSFYEEMFRLHGWPYDPESVARPGVVGKFTNTYIYDQLPPGVMDELRAMNPKNASGHRKARLHQGLTYDVGNSHLEKQIASTTTIMRIADDWPSFKRMFAKAFPKSGDQIDILPDVTRG